MPLERGYTMVQIRESGRDVLRTLAWKRKKPMYEVLEEVLNEALIDEEIKNISQASMPAYSIPVS